MTASSLAQIRVASGILAEVYIDICEDKTQVRELCKLQEVLDKLYELRRMVDIEFNN